MPLSFIAWQGHMWNLVKNWPQKWVKCVVTPNCDMIMIDLTIWQSHSKLLILCHIGSRESYLTTFEKINSNQLTPPSFITFSPKKVLEICSGQSLGKYVHVFTLNPNRPYLAWPPIPVFTSQPIYNTFKLDLKWWQSEILFVVNFTIEPSNAHKYVLLWQIQICTETTSWSSPTGEYVLQQ